MFSPVACTASFDFRFCVVPANAGTHSHRAPWFSKAVNHRFKRLPPRRMGPCFRRDNKNYSRGAFRPSLANSLSSPSKQRAQGMPGARCTRGLVCQKLRIWRTRAYRAAETLRHPLRNGFTAYFVLSPVSGLFCHRHCRSLRKLDASVAAPGPHDFAVRLGVFVRRKKRLTPKRPSHPQPNAS
jgi:hypothetical protein